MSFELTPEQVDIQTAAREFAQGEFPDRARDADQGEHCPKELYKMAADLGFQGIFFPEQYGGAGLGCLEFCLIMEEFWRAGPGIGQSLSSAVFGSDLLLLYGTEEQKRKYLPPLTKGSAIMGTAITEPNAGSDVSAAITTAVATPMPKPLVALVVIAIVGHMPSNMLKTPLFSHRPSLTIVL